MFKEKVSLLNTFWSNQPEISLLEDFHYSEEYYWGRIQVEATPKEPLLIRVRIPLSYPFSNDSMSVRFYCLNATGIRHLNDDNSICIVVPKNTDFISRLREEVTLLLKWRDKFYINEEKDDRYDYLIVNPSDYNTFLFTNLSHNFQKHNFGEFKALKFVNNTFEGLPEANNYFIQSIGKFKCQWSKRIHDQKHSLEGYYYFVHDEPVVRLRAIAKNWLDLDRYFCQKFKEHLYSLKTAKGIPENIYLLLGYQIPESTEVHWEAIKINSKRIPVNAKRVARGYFEYYFTDQPVSYSKTVNTSYDRFFGRGGLHPDFSNKKVLLLGAGAIGSSIGNILTRGGLKYLGICDMDFVETGNICRSSYRLDDVTQPKWVSLFKDLAFTSPFIELQYEPLIDKALIEEHMTKERERLNVYDYIIDCTSDMELAWVLDKLNLKSTIINISISNEARELVCVIGNKQVASEKALIFETLNQDSEILFYEGTGCWSPTFKASYYDINSMVNIAIKNINYHFTTKKGLNSFVIKCSPKNFNIIDY